MQVSGRTEYFNYFMLGDKIFPTAKQQALSFCIAITENEILLAVWDKDKALKVRS